MNALILAAGYGSRIAALGPSKPLVTVAGHSLLEWSVWQAAQVGIRHAVVVTGHAAEAVEAQLPRIAARCGVTLTPCRLADASRPNGHSVLAGAALLPGNFLLLMADHMFETRLLAKLVSAMDRKDGATLAVDRRCDGPTIDPDDATWVARRADGTIAAIGKQLINYDAVDCGAFIATPDLCHAIAAAIAEGAAGSLSEGMQRLAAQGLADTIDVTGCWWIDVDDPAMHALAERMAPRYLGAPSP